MATKVGGDMHRRRGLSSFVQKSGLVPKPDGIPCKRPRCREVTNRPPTRRFRSTRRRSGRSGPPPTTRLPCRRSWVRVPSSALESPAIGTAPSSGWETMATAWLHSSMIGDGFALRLDHQPTSGNAGPAPRSARDCLEIGWLSSRRLPGDRALVDEVVILLRGSQISTKGHRAQSGIRALA